MRAESDRGRVDVDADATRRALEAMLHDPERDELVIRDNVGRDGADAVERIARALGLYFRPYGRGTNTVLVASKVPLPNYRADLDGRRRAERDVAPVSADAADAVERWLARVEADANDASANDADANDADANDADANDASASRRAFEPHPSAAGPPPRTASLGGSSVGKKRLESGRRDAASALARCAATDALERERERRRVSTPSALRLDAARARLPAHAAKDAFLRALDGTQVLVVSGETGCGKTTQLPRFVLDRALAAGDASTTNVVCTQPRRVSAVSVAARVAHERGEALGDRVGYQIRLEARRSEATRLTFCTTGTLLRRLAEDSELRSVSHVFVDEIHERGMNEDFLLVVLRNLILERPDLKLVLMSATLDAEKFAGYFDGAPTLHVPGFTYPVREMFLEEVLADASAKGAPIEIRTEGDTIRTGGSSARGGFRGTSRFGRGGRGGTRRRAYGDGSAPPREEGEEAAGPPPTDPEEEGEEEAFAGILRGEPNREYSREPLSDARFASLDPVVHRSLRAWRERCEADDRVDVELVRDVLRHVVRHGAEEGSDSSDFGASDANAPGSVLVFLTGWDEIQKLCELCRADPALRAPACRVLPLHGSMPTANQREIFDRPPAGVRKIVLATNVAETSVTIDDVSHVIDAGKAKEKSYDALNNLACLTPRWISKASAHQRRGRAGRTKPGTCYRVYTEAQHAAMAPRAIPELLRTPLEELVLAVKALGLGDAAAFCARALDPPEPKSVQNALELLRDIGALTTDEGDAGGKGNKKKNKKGDVAVAVDVSVDVSELTALGRHLAALPVDPRTGKMLIVASVLGCLSPALTVAACAAYKDPFVLPAERRAEADASRLRFAGESRSDHLARVAAFDGWRDAKRRGGAGAGYAFCRDRFLSPATLELAADMRRQFGKLLRDAGFLLAEEKEGGESIFVGGESSSAGESSEYYSGKYDERAFASALDDPRAPHNANASDARVMRAAICAGMYPRVVSIRRKGRGGARAVFETIEDGAVDLHPGSVNARYGLRFPHDWLAYGEKVKTEKVYVRDSTCVPAVALLLFGGPLEIEGAEGEEEADDDSVNGDSVTNGGDSVNNGGVVKVLRGAYAFNADRRTLDLVRRLRDALDDVLRAKIERPRDERVGERGRWLARAVSALVADEEREREREREAASAAVRANGRFDDETSSRRGGGHSFFSRGPPGGSTREGPGAGARGGDWACPRGCGVVFASKPRCFRCGEPRPPG